MAGEIQIKLFGMVKMTLSIALMNPETTFLVRVE
jgi:hypothetical protein